jgi:uncharacterized protein YjlB
MQLEGVMPQQHFSAAAHQRLAAMQRQSALQQGGQEYLDYPPSKQQRNE